MVIILWGISGIALASWGFYSIALGATRVQDSRNRRSLRVFVVVRFIHVL